MIQKTNIDISDTIQQIGNDAVREAQRKNLENGIPNVYSKNGVLYFQLPDEPSPWITLSKKANSKNDWIL